MVYLQLCSSNCGYEDTSSMIMALTTYNTGVLRLSVSHINNSQMQTPVPAHPVPSISNIPVSFIKAIEDRFKYFVSGDCIRVSSQQKLISDLTEDTQTSIDFLTLSYLILKRWMSAQASVLPKPNALMILAYPCDCALEHPSDTYGTHNEDGHPDFLCASIKTSYLEMKLTAQSDKIELLIYSYHVAALRHSWFECLKDGVNAQKDVVNAEKEGDADVNEEFEDIFEEETFTQWIETNVERVSKPRAVQSVNVVCPQTPQRVVTPPSSKKRVVKPSSYLISPYMNKKTKVISLIKKLEFVLGNSLFAMQGDKFETFFETRLGHELSSVRLNMQTLAPRLWIDANFKTENDEQTRISIIVNAIKKRAERDPAKMKTVVENQEEDDVKSK
ncbi:hypothetical protein Tco_0448437 [Tanacetum coccineum]